MDQLIFAINNNEKEKVRKLLKSNPSLKHEKESLIAALDDRNNKMVILLLDLGVNPLKTLPSIRLFKWAVLNGHLPTIKRFLLNKPKLLNFTDSRGQTALHWASESGSKESIEYLLDCNADTTIRDNLGNRAIDYLDENGHIKLKKKAEAITSEKIYQQQLRAQQKFFDHTRTTENTTTTLLNKFYANRHKKDNTEEINALNVPRRRIITADAGAVKKALDELSEKNRDNLTDANKIATKLRWHRKKGKNWNRERVKISNDVKINYQHQPLPGQLGNFYMTGIGHYGDNGSNYILYIINEITRPDPFKARVQRANERKLAKLLLKASKTGQPITEIDLENEGIQLFYYAKDKKKYQGYLQRLSYLVSVKEITRRMNQGIRGDGTEVTEIPFAVAYYRALKLVKAGHLSMKDIFDANAAYGLPTGQSIATTERNIANVLTKLHNLNKLYEQKFPQDNLHTETFHQELLAAYGGDGDTDGEAYSSDEEVSGPKI